MKPIFFWCAWPQFTLQDLDGSQRLALFNQLHIFLFEQQVLNQFLLFLLNKQSLLCLQSIHVCGLINLKQLLHELRDLLEITFYHTLAETCHTWFFNSDTALLLQLCCNLVESFINQVLLYHS